MSKTVNDFKKSYQLGREIGSGNYSIVRLAINVLDGNKAAVKIVMKRKLTKQDEDALRSEITILEKINKHPTIIEMLGFYTDSVNYYLVSEYMDGGELFDRIQRKESYSENDARNVVIKLANTLKFLKDHDIAHRDLKPENILLKHQHVDDDIKLADFGFARYVAKGCKTACGTPGYTAPEVISGLIYDFSCDVWSMGVITYILLSGYPPFYHEQQIELYKIIREGKYQLHSPWWDDVSPEAKDFISKVLVVDVKKRLDIESVLNHPWIAVLDPKNDADISQQVLPQLSLFNAKRHLRAAIRLAIISNNLRDVAERIRYSKDPDDGLRFPEVYSLGKKLGEGAYSEVLLATHKTNHLTFAVKCITKTKLSEADREALKTEVGILREVNHPSIIKTFGFFIEDEFFYLVTELMSGGELFDRIVARKHYSEEDAKAALRTLADCLCFLHHKDIVHRDLKPENILLKDVTDNAPIKLCDFGFARYVKEGCRTACGTPGYVAPEILTGMVYGTGVDVWSLGVILYILLCGFPPFYHQNQQELFRQIKTASFQFDDEYWGLISAEAKDLIRGMLTVDKVERLMMEEVLSHPWMTGQAPSEDISSVVLPKMRLFNAKRKLRSAIRGCIAANKMIDIFERTNTKKEPPPLPKRHYNVSRVRSELMNIL